MDDQIFLEAMARVGERDFMVLGAGFITVRLWGRLSADRLSPEQVHAIEAAQQSVERIPDRWHLARTSLQEALEAIMTVDADIVAQTALAKYAGSIATLAPEAASCVLGLIREVNDPPFGLSRQMLGVEVFPTSFNSELVSAY